MTRRVDQRICIKFCFKLGHPSAETVRMIKKAFGVDSLSEAQIKLWYRRFKDGRESVNSTIHILKGLQQAEHQKMLNACQLQSMKISN
jgi:phosphoserine phosphatase